MEPVLDRVWPNEANIYGPIQNIHVLLILVLFLDFAWFLNYDKTNSNTTIVSGSQFSISSITLNQQFGYLLNIKGYIKGSTAYIRY